jgi:aspartate/methionine/tyrosine aminotransferase
MIEQVKQRYSFTVLRERLSQHGRPIVNFALGDFDRSLPAALAETIRENSSLMMKRHVPADLAKFSAAAVDYLAWQYGVEVSPAEILPVPSGRAAMTALASCILEPGNGVVVTEPGYPVFARLATHHHARILVARLDPDRGFAPRLDEISQEDADSVRLVALNYPNNPTGAVISKEVATALDGRFGSGTVLFNDATYGPLTHEGTAHSILGKDLSGIRGNRALELHSLSKLFPLGPLGIAFLAGSAPLIEEIRHYTDFAWSPPSSLQMQATMRCFQSTDHIAEIRQYFEERLERLRETLVDVGFEPYPSPGGMYLLCKAPAAVGGATTPTAQAAADVLLDEFDLAVVAWDRPPHGYLRFSSLYSTEDLQSLGELGDRLALSGR